MIFKLHEEKGTISDCGKYRIIKGIDGMYEIYVNVKGQWFMKAERKLYTKAIKFCSDTERLKKITKDID